MGIYGDGMRLVPKRFEFFESSCDFVNLCIFAIDPFPAPDPIKCHVQIDSYILFTEDLLQHLI